LLKRIDDFRDFCLVLLLVLVCIVITPWNNLEAIVLPKFAVLLLFGLLAVTLAITSPRIRELSRGRLFLLTVAAAFWITINPIQNHVSLEERLFGVYGRNLGVFTYLIFFLLLFPAILFQRKNIKTFKIGFLFAHLIAAVYFFFQLAGKDPAEWVYVYELIPNTTLGNPNFVSAHFAIAAIASLSLAVEVMKQSWHLSTLYILIALSFGVIVFLTGSSQGLLIIVFLILVMGWLEIRFRLKGMAKTKKHLRSWNAVQVLFLLFLLTLSTLGADRFIASLGARPEYWGNAVSQIADSPIWGQGFDMYGDKYSVFKEPGSSLFSDSPHNLLSELGAFGGVPLLICYLLIQLSVLTRFIKFLKSQDGANRRDIEFLFLLWIGFHLQSFVNPTTLPFLTLGSLVTGLLYGQLNSLNHFKETSQGPLSKSTKHSSTAKLLATSLFALGALPTGAILGTAPIRKDAAFRDAAEMGDGSKLISATRKWPFNSRLSLETAKILQENGYNSLALTVLRDLVEENPLSLSGWTYIYRYSKNPQEQSTARARILELDPYNQEFRDLAP